MQFEVTPWLSRLDCDGVQLNLKQLLYYQKKSSLINLTPKQTIQAKMAGSYQAKTKGRGMEFDEARHYQPGDDIRAIDWRVTARSGKTHTKLYREEKERPVFILADLSRTMHFGTQFVYKSVQVAHLAALIAWAAKDRGDRIGGLVFNHYEHKEFKPMTRQKAVLSFIHGLLDVHDNSNQQPVEFQFSDACARLRRLAHPGSLVFVLSDLSGLDASAKQHLSQISRHSEIVAYQVTDPFEHALPSVAHPEEVNLSDGSATQTITLGEKNTEDAYRNRYDQQQQAISRTLNQCKIPWTAISAGLPLELQLNANRRK